MLEFIKKLFRREPVIKSDHYLSSPTGESIPVYEEAKIENKPYIFSGSYKGCKFSPVGEPLTSKHKCLRCEISWWADKIGDKICPSCSDDRYVYPDVPDNRPVYWRKEQCTNCGCVFEYESPTLSPCPFCGVDYDIYTLEYKRIK